jgi:hypothetical protein
MPGPQFAGLVSEFLPVDRATLERAVDRVLDTFDSVAGQLPTFGQPSALLISAGTIALGMLTLVAIRRRGRSGDQGNLSHYETRRVEMALLRSLPNSWNWDLARR